MGLLIKKTIDAALFERYEKKYASGTHYAMKVAPFVIGKFLKLNTEEQAIDFKARQVNYIARKVPGYNIFFIQAGFSEVPDHIIKDYEIEQALDQLCNWYFETTIKKKPHNFYRVKSKQS